MSTTCKIECMRNTETKLIIIVAIAFTATAIVLGYLSLGIVPAFLFTFGYLGGLVVWTLVPSSASFRQIAPAFFITLALFILHKVEEREMDFFPQLSQITGVPVPDANSPIALSLYGLATCWLLIPFLVARRSQFGYFLAWTFFCSMGITELAHFVLPLFRDRPYGYFPGMWSVFGLAPVACYGMWCLSKKKSAKSMA